MVFGMWWLACALANIFIVSLGLGRLVAIPVIGPGLVRIIMADDMVSAVYTEKTEKNENGAAK